MKAMLLNKTGSFSSEQYPLFYSDVAEPCPSENEILLKVNACGVCHTELDEIEGRLTPPSLPIILGHQVIGTVEDSNGFEDQIKKGTRVGVGWIYSSCGICKFCLTGRENLCPDFKATGKDRNGGYAQFMVANKDYVYEIPDKISDAEAAPLLCAGAVGYRALKLTGINNGDILGMTGFGASSHLVLKTAKYLFPNSPIFVFARSAEERNFALSIGASWIGNTTDQPPEKIQAIIDTTPVWTPVIEALKNLSPGGRLIINAIRKEDTDKEILTSIDYSTHIWQEKEIKSVANVTRKDVNEFLQIAAEIDIHPEVQEYELRDANKALLEIKQKKIKGAKVLNID
jgi:propanol-preferring alcohol dehydrogenase